MKECQDNDSDKITWHTDDCQCNKLQKQQIFRNRGMLREVAKINNCNIKEITQICFKTKLFCKIWENFSAKHTQWISFK